MKKTILFLVLLLIPLVYAAPPSQVFGSASADSLAMRISDLPVVKVNTAYKLKIHVFNGTTGYPVNSGVSCYLHLYNESLKHIAETEATTTDHVFDYELEVSNTNFSKAGYYSYIVQCNTSTHGSYLAGYIEATNDGKVPGSREGMALNLILGVAIMLGFLMFLSFSMDEEHFILKLINIFLSVIVLSFIPLSLLLGSNIFTTFYKTYTWFFVIFWLYVGGYFVYFILKKMGIIVGGSE